MKKIIAWIMSAIMSLSPATAANTESTEPADVADTAIVAEADAGTQDNAEDKADQNDTDDETDYDDLMNEYASEVQSWTYLADEDVWVIPVNTENETREMPEGEAPADGEAPEKPDGEAPADGEAPEKPDGGEMPTDGQAPEKPDGEMPTDGNAPANGEAPAKPDGEAPTDGEAPEKPDGGTNTQPADDADQKGAPQDGDALPLQGIPGELVLGVDTDSDGTVDVTAENYTETVTGVLIWVDGAHLTELVEISE